MLTLDVAVAADVDPLLGHRHCRVVTLQLERQIAGQAFQARRRLADEDPLAALDVDQRRLLHDGAGGRRDRRRQVQLDRDRRGRDRHHEDDEEHEHHVHEGRDVHVRVLAEVELTARLAADFRRHT